MKFTKITISCLFAALGSVALAQSKTDSGFYGIGTFGTSTINGNLNATGGGAGVSQTQGNGWQIGLGFDLNKYLAFEGTYGQLFKSVSDLSMPGVNWTNNSATNASGFNFSALGKFNILENTELFAGTAIMLGSVNSKAFQNAQGTIQKSDETKNFNPMGLTAGVNFALDRKTSIRVSYSAFKSFTWDHAAGVNTNAYSESDKVSALNLGLIVKF